MFGRKIIAELAEIDENLFRSPLTPSQATSAIFRRKTLLQRCRWVGILRKFGPKGLRFSWRERIMPVKTPTIMTPPLNSPGVLISFETMKFRRGHFRAKPDPLLARQLTCLIDGMHNTRMGSELRALSHLSCVLAKEAGMHGQVSFSRILPNVRWWYLQTAQIMTAMGAAPKCLSVFSTSGC